MGKYLELFRSAFDSSIDEKTKLENRPYVAYSTVTGDVVYTVIPKPVVNGPWVAFTAEESNSSIGLTKLSTNQTLEYSTDTTTWNTFDTTTNISLNNGDHVYVRGLLSVDNTSSNYTQFKMSGKIAAGGNCNALWNYEDLNAPLKKYCGYRMFYNCTSLTTAPELPATTLAGYCYQSMFQNCTSLSTAPELPATISISYCYQSMFRGCSSLVVGPAILPTTKLDIHCYDEMFYGCYSLTTAPELPATTLAGYCYYYMFYNCTSLTTAPELRATKLADACYSSMFRGCSSLATAPELPATTLAEKCYQNMFHSCTSITTAPELPATTLARYCYDSMFNGCAKLNYIKCLATDISATYCTSNWAVGVSSTGTFIKHPYATWSTGYSDIPKGWTVRIDFDVNDFVTFTAEQKNSTIGFSKLSSNQTLKYRTDSSDWELITQSTTITLNNIGDKVYIGGYLSNDNTSSNYTQFKMSGKIAASGNCNAIWNCIDLNTSLKKFCGYKLFSGCTSLTTAPELPATTLARYCYSGMFNGCKSLTTAPEILPATTLTEGCYSSMFLDCTSLTTAPELPATKLASYCYQDMFRGCWSIKYIKCLATDISATYCTSNWAVGVSNTGTFIKHPDMNNWVTSSNNGIPSNWTVEDAVL